MNKILRLDPTYDIWLSYSWSNNNHGICGHTYEVIDYYHILKEHFKVGILLAEDIDWNTFEKSIISKYDFNDAEIKDIKKHTVFANRPTVVTGKNILFTDGGIVNNSSKTLLFDNVLYFACGNKQIKDNEDENVWILQDDRVYEPVKRNGINYKKKILFSRLKKICSSKNRALLYATKNCRKIEDFEQYKQYGDILAIVNVLPKPVDGIEFALPPIDNIFEQFTTYVYTPVERKWDCSPRFIAECKHYGKQVVYHDIDYWDVDRGLRVRKEDIDNNFDSLRLESTDEIVAILRQIIC
jgi:hypothetical protein